VTEVEHGLDASLEFLHHVHGPAILHRPGPSGIISSRCIGAPEGDHAPKASVEERRELGRAIAGETSAAARWQKN
jgi:hypothetical protein